MRDWFYANSDGDPSGAEAVRALACRRLDAAWDKLDAHLGESHDYLIGDKLSTADFMAVMLMRWTRNMPRPALGWPNLARYIRKLRALPSFIALNVVAASASRYQFGRLPMITMPRESPLTLSTASAPAYNCASGTQTAGYL
jgi:glutathione S-transferase